MLKKHEPTNKIRMKEIMNFSFISCKGNWFEKIFCGRSSGFGFMISKLFIKKIPGNFIINVKVVSIEIPEIVDVQPI